MSAGFCTQCGHSSATDAAFCAQCGAPRAAAPPWAAGSPVGAPGGRELCPGCGVQAPTNGSRCAVCHGDLPRPRPRAPEVGGDRFWVGLTATFRCRACGHRSPLNHLDLDGSVVCASCGIDQAFDVSQWRRGLAHAHAVGDLAGPDPEGRFPSPGVAIASVNPFARVGIDRAFAEDEQQAVVAADGTTHSLAVRALPGHPLCKRCRTPLALLQADARGVETQCPTCSAVRRYGRPSGLPASSSGLLGAVADAHDTAQREAELERDGGGAVLVKCPNCHAPLDVAGEPTLVTCKYCSATSRLSPHTLRTLGRKALEPQLWWLLFSGPSPERAALVDRVQRTARRQGPPPGLFPDAAPRSRAPGAAVTIAVIAIALGVALPVAVGAWLAMSAAAPPEASAPPSPASVAAAPPAAPPAAEPVTPVAPQAPAPPPRALVELRWRATVRTARGKAVRPGTRCELGVSTNGADFGRTWVGCGDLVLYDSQQEFNGMSSWGAGVLEARPPRGEGWAYLLSYSDTGQRSGRPQMVASSEGGTVEVEDADARVTLTLEPLSEPRVGAPLFGQSGSFEPITRALVVAGTTGGAPVKEGTACQLRVRLFAVGEHGPQCKAAVTCAQRPLYVTDTPGASTPCELDAEGIPLQVVDQKKSTADRDPSFTGSVPEGTFTVADDPPRGEWTVTLRAAE